MDKKVRKVRRGFKWSNRLKRRRSLDNNNQAPQQTKEVNRNE